MSALEYVDDRSLNRMLNTQIMVQSWCELHTQYRAAVASGECQTIGFMEVPVGEIEDRSNSAAERRAEYVAERKVRDRRGIG